MTSNVEHLFMFLSAMCYLWRELEFLMDVPLEEKSVYVRRTWSASLWKRMVVEFVKL